MSSAQPLDAYASERHYLDHLLPVWQALHPDERGTLHVPPALADRAPGCPVTVGPPRRVGPPVLVASFWDSRRVAPRRTVLMEHGAGQTYQRAHGAYAGGPRRDNVVLFLCPTQRVADANRASYPNTPAVVVGIPRLDGLWTGPIPEHPTVAVAFHWTANFVPETVSALPHYRSVLPALAADDRWTLLGHGHPRAEKELRQTWRWAGVEYEPDFNRVLDRAHILVADNTCVAPDTLVLCADLTWRPAGDLVVGDRVVACDEEGVRPVRANGVLVDREDRRLRTASVTGNARRVLPCALITTTHGSAVVSLTHPWLARRSVEHRYMIDGRKPGQRWHWKSYHSRWDWRETSLLSPGDRVAHLVAPWSEDSTRQAGWLAGMLDGEGNLHIGRPSAYGSRRTALSVAQNDGPVLDELRRVLSDEKLASYAQPVRGGRGNRCVKLTIGGSLTDLLRILGTLRPIRLLGKAVREEMWVGANVSAQVEQAEVLSIEPLGPQEVCVLATSTGTFVAGGFVAHNSVLYEWAALGRPVVVLDAPWFRRNVDHGLRFWSHADIGIRVREPEQLIDAVAEAVQDPSDVRARRESLVADLFRDLIDGRSARRAADAIRETLTTEARP